MKKPEDTKSWRPPTRRLFVAMLGAAAAALVAHERPTTPVRDPRLPRWIGHA